MIQGQVEIALSTATAVEKEMNISGGASLESLMAFAASPIAFDALELGMITHELRARVRIACRCLTPGFISSASPAFVRGAGRWTNID